jgi:hypothetical protein
MLVMGIVLLTAIILLALNSGLSDALPFLYLLPWLIALGAVLIAPLVYICITRGVLDSMTRLYGLYAHTFFLHL